MRRIVFAWCSALAALTLMPWLHASSWTKVSSAHFDLLSSAPASDTRQMAVALAGYLEVLAVYVPREAPPAFTAVVFDDPREFREYCVTGGMATHLDDGRYVVGLCVPRAGIRQTGVPTLFHEVAHAWIDGRYPDPFSHGIVQALETVEITGESARIGMPIVNHVRRLRTSGIKPMNELLYHRLTAEEKYPQTWVLGHYLLFGVDAGRTRPGLWNYLQSLERATWGRNRESLYGYLDTTEAALHRALQDHVGRSQWRVEKMPVPDVAVSPAAPAPPRDLYVARARFAMFQAKFDAAEREVAALRAIAPQDPELAVLARNLRLQQERWKLLRTPAKNREPAQD